MWWKKLLYFLLVIVLGIGIITLSGSITFNSLSKNLLKNGVKNHQYALVESFFNYTTPIDKEKFLIKDDDDVHFEIYPCLVKQPYFKIEKSTNKYGVAYDIVEEAIGFSFFHLPKTFAFTDKDVKSEVLLSLNNGNQYHLYLNNADLEENAPNFHINFPDFIDQYYSLNIYVTYNDFIAFTDDANVSINQISLIDGNGIILVNQELNDDASFNNPMGILYREACQNYRDYILQYGEAHSVTTFERKQALLDKIDNITKSNSDKYIAKPSKTIVLRTTDFILAISITSAVYLSISIVVTRLIFFRKKRY